MTDFTQRMLRNAKTARRSPTYTEWALWQLIRKNQLGVRFTRQHCIWKYGYRLDFYCAAKKLAVELDGPYHQQPEQRIHDERRDQYLASIGITVLHFLASQNTYDVRDKIAQYLEELASVPMIGPKLPTVSDLIAELAKLKDLNTAVGLKPPQRVRDKVVIGRRA